MADERIEGHGVREVLARDVGSASVDGLEDRDVLADVGAGGEAEAADEAGAEVRDDVAVEVLEEQDVEAGGVEDELHAGVVHDDLVVL